MLNTHVAQQFSTLLAARGGEDLGSRGAGDGDRRLPHTAGRGVDQHLVAGGDAGQVVQAVPGGGVRGGHRGRLLVGQAGRQRDGQVGVAGDERAPAAVGGQAADMVADLVVGHVRSDRGHHTGEVGAQLRQPPLEGGVAAERDQHVGEVDAGCADRDLDLSRPRRNPVERNEFHRLQVAGRADLQAHPVVLVVDDGGSPLVGAQRTGAQPRGVPLRRFARRSRPPRTRRAVAAPAARRRWLRRHRSGWRAGADARCRSPASGRAARPAPGWPRRRPARSGRCGSRRTGGAARRGSLAIRGRCAPDAARTRGPAAAHWSSASPFFGPVRMTTPVNPPARELIRAAVRRVRAWSACCGQHMVVHCAPWVFNASVNVVATTSAVAEVLISSQVPASAWSTSGNSRCCHSMVSSRSASTRSLWPFSDTPVPNRSPCTAQQDRAVLVEHVEVGLDPGRRRLWSPACSSSGRCGRDRRRVADGHPAATPARPAPQGLDVRMGRNGLETGIQQRGVHAVGALLRADLAGQRDLGQHGVPASPPSAVCTAARPVNAGPY